MSLPKVRISAKGRIAIPADYRKALGLKAGDEVLIMLSDGELRVFTPDEGIRLAQESVGRYIPEGRSLSNELIAERRAEAARD